MRTCTTQEIENYINQQSGINFKPVFDQYLRHTNIPTFNYQIKGKVLSYYWTADVRNFNMPVTVQINGDKTMLLHPVTRKKKLKIKGIDPEHFKVDDFNFYIKTRKF